MIIFSLFGKLMKNEMPQDEGLLSQLSFSVYAGQVVFREALRQGDDKELSDMETFL